MTTLQIKTVCCALACAASGIALQVVNADTTMQHALELSADAAEVTVVPRQKRGASLELPTLDYRFEFAASCKRPFAPESLAITVADTHVRLNAERLAADAGSGALTMRIPAAQIGPLVIADFCLSAPASGEAAPLTEDSPRSKRLTIRGTLSANASLRCSDGQSEEIVYTSQPLDVQLDCDTPPGEASSSQMPSVN